MTRGTTIAIKNSVFELSPLPIRKQRDKESVCNVYATKKNVWIMMDGV